MRPRIVTAVEHQRLSVDDRTGDLTEAEADLLGLVGERRRGFCTRGYRSITVAQYCGIVSLGQRVLEICPKVGDDESVADGRALLLRLLHTAGTFPLFSDLALGHELRHARLLDVFIEAFFDSVSQIVRGGLLRQYRDESDDLVVVRGRIDTKRQFAVNADRHDRVACSFDELTEDNVWNQLLKVGLRTVRWWIGSPELQRRWLELMVTLDGVTDAALNAKTLDRLVFDRRARRYETALRWVRLILGLLSPNLRAGEHDAAALLLDMNSLFESAVAAIARRGVRGSQLRVDAQETGHALATLEGSDRSQFFHLRPDLVYRRDGRVVAVGDTKWKRLDVDRTGRLCPEPDDVYQMHAYAAAYRCEHLALIYPWHSGLNGSRETAYLLPRQSGFEPRLSVVCIDLHDRDFRIGRGQLFSPSEAPTQPIPLVG